MKINDQATLAFLRDLCDSVFLLTFPPVLEHDEGPGQRSVDNVLAHLTNNILLYISGLITTIS